jgi:hypothetical protein
MLTLGVKHYEINTDECHYYLLLACALFMSVLTFTASFVRTNPFSFIQTRKNEALHWIESVNKKIRADTKELEVAQEKRYVHICCACTWHRAFPRSIHMERSCLGRA